MLTSKILVLGVIVSFSGAMMNTNSKDTHRAKLVVDSFLVDRCGSECFAKSLEFLEVAQWSDSTLVVRYCLVQADRCPSGATVGIKVDEGAKCARVEGLPLPDFSEGSVSCCGIVTPDEARRLATEWGFSPGSDESDLFLARGPVVGDEAAYQWIVMAPRKERPENGTHVGLSIDACSGGVIGTVEITSYSCPMTVPNKAMQADGAARRR